MLNDVYISVFESRFSILDFWQAVEATASRTGAGSGLMSGASEQIANTVGPIQQASTTAAALRLSGRLDASRGRIRLRRCAGREKEGRS